VSARSAANAGMNALEATLLPPVTEIPCSSPALDWRRCASEFAPRSYERSHKRRNSSWSWRGSHRRSRWTSGKCDRLIFIPSMTLTSSAKRMCRRMLLLKVRKEQQKLHALVQCFSALFEVQDPTSFIRAFTERTLS